MIKLVFIRIEEISGGEFSNQVKERVYAENKNDVGIVADSIPEKEHQECINKAKAVMVALAEAEGGSNL